MCFFLHGLYRLIIDIDQLTLLGNTTHSQNYEIRKKVFWRQKLLRLINRQFYNVALENNKSVIISVNYYIFFNLTVGSIICSKFDVINNKAKNNFTILNQQHVAKLDRAFHLNARLLVQIQLSSFFMLFVKFLLSRNECTIYSA